MILSLHEILVFDYLKRYLGKLSLYKKEEITVPTKGLLKKHTVWSNVKGVLCRVTLGCRSYLIRVSYVTE